MCAAATMGAAQQPSPQLPAPPPMRFVSRADRTELDGTKDPKSRLRATIRLAEDRLKSAEIFTEQKKYEEASAALGGYLGLIGYVREFIATLPADKGSTRDINRHFEIAVRPHIPRLAVLRRTTPASYAIHLKDAEEYIKDTRAQALDSFYGQTVLRERPMPAQTPTPEEPETLKRP